MIAESWEELPGERKMVASVLRWLLRIGWLGPATMAAYEVPWRGRRIDLVTTNSKGQLTTFEFKMDGTRRVFEQAIYNSISAHRSFVVSGARPSPDYQVLAETHGLGLIVVNGKVDLLHRHFPSQATKPWFDRDTFRGLARLRGLESASPSRFAEAFYGPKLVLDLGPPPIVPGVGTEPN